MASLKLLGMEPGETPEERQQSLNAFLQQKEVADKIGYTWSVEVKRKGRAKGMQCYYTPPEGGTKRFRSWEAAKTYAFAEKQCKRLKLAATELQGSSSRTPASDSTPAHDRQDGAKKGSAQEHRKQEASPACQSTGYEVDRFISRDLNAAVGAIRALAGKVQQDGRDHLASLQEKLLQAAQTFEQGIPGGTIALAGSNGIGKTFIVNLWMLSTEVDARTYKHANGVKGELQLLVAMEGVTQVWRSVHVAAHVEELAEYHCTVSKQQLIDSLGPKVELHQPLREDLERISHRKLEEYRLTYESLREYCELGETPLKQAAFFWPSGDTLSVTTCCINQSSYSEVWHAVVTYQSLDWVRKQVHEAMAWVMSLPDEEREDFLLIGKLPDTAADKLKLEVINLFVKDATAAEGQWELRDEVEAIADKAVIFAGTGEDSFVDRCFVREKISGCLETQRDSEGRVTNELQRAMLKSVDGYAPCAVLKGKRLLDGPGYNDANPFRRACADRMIAMADTVVLVIVREASANESVLESLFETSFGRTYASGQHNLAVYHYIEKNPVTLPGDSSHTSVKPTLDVVFRQSQQLASLRRNILFATEEDLRTRLKGLVSDDLREEKATGDHKKRVHAQVEQILRENTVQLMPLLVLHTSLMLNWRKVLQLEAEGQDVAKVLETCQGSTIFGLLDSRLMTAGQEIVKGVRGAVEQAEKSTNDLMNKAIAVGHEAQRLKTSILEDKGGSEGRVMLMDNFESLTKILERFGREVMELVHSFFEGDEVEDFFDRTNERLQKRWPAWSKKFNEGSRATMREALDPNNTKGVTGFNVPLFLFRGFGFDIRPLLDLVEDAAKECAQELTSEFQGILVRLFGEGVTRSARVGKTEAPGLFRSIEDFCNSSVRDAMAQGLEWWKLSGSQQRSRRRLDENVVGKGWLPSIQQDVLRDQLLEGLNLQQPVESIKQEFEQRLPMVFPAVHDALWGRCQDELTAAVTEMKFRLLEGGSLGRRKNQQPLFLRILLDFCNRIKDDNEVLQEAYERGIKADLQLLQREATRFRGLEQALQFGPLAGTSDLEAGNGAGPAVRSASVGALVAAISEAYAADMPRMRAIHEVSEGSLLEPLTTVPRLEPIWADDDGQRGILVEGLKAVALPAIEEECNMAKIQASLADRGLKVSRDSTEAQRLLAAFCTAVFGSANPTLVKQCELLVVRSLINQCHASTIRSAVEFNAGCRFANLLLRLASPAEGEETTVDMFVQLACLSRQLHVNVRLHAGEDLRYTFEGDPVQPFEVYHLALLPEQTADHVPAGRVLALTPTSISLQAKVSEASGSNTQQPTPAFPAQVDQGAWAGFPFLHLVFDADSLMAVAESADVGNMGVLLRRLTEQPNEGRVGISIPFKVLLDLDKRKGEETRGQWAVEALRFAKWAGNVLGFPIGVQIAESWTADLSGIELVVRKVVDRRSFGILSWAASLQRSGAQVALVTDDPLLRAEVQSFPVVPVRALLETLYDKKDCTQMVLRHS